VPLALDQHDCMIPDNSESTSEFSIQEVWARGSNGQLPKFLKPGTDVVAWSPGPRSHKSGKACLAPFNSSSCSFEPFAGSPSVT
jgi:hypothetical protein